MSIICAPAIPEYRADEQYTNIDGFISVCGFQVRVWCHDFSVFFESYRGTIQGTSRRHGVDHTKNTSSKCPYTEKERAEAWELCATTVKNHSDEMLKRWEDEINMLLTFVCIVITNTYGVSQS